MSLWSSAEAVNEDECIKNNLCRHSISAMKEWICESQSLADIFIFFISQKSKELHLCVDYCELNVIIIKNCYLLLLINELLD